MLNKHPFLGVFLIFLGFKFLSMDSAVRFAPRTVWQEAQAQPRAIYQKAPPEIREGFGYSAKVALFRLLSVAFHALTGIKKPAPEVTHSFKVSFAWFFATITT